MGIAGPEGKDCGPFIRSGNETFEKHPLSPNFGVRLKF